MSLASLLYVGLRVFGVIALGLAIKRQRDAQRHYDSQLDPTTRAGWEFIRDHRVAAAILLPLVIAVPPLVFGLALSQDYVAWGWVMTVVLLAWLGVYSVMSTRFYLQNKQAGQSEAYLALQRRSDVLWTMGMVALVL